MDHTIEKPLVALRVSLGLYYAWWGWHHWQNPLLGQTLTGDWYTLAASHPLGLLRGMLSWASMNGHAFAVVWPWCELAMGTAWLLGLAIRWLSLATLVIVGLGALMQFHTSPWILPLAYFQAVLVGALMWAQVGYLYGLDGLLAHTHAWVTDRWSGVRSGLNLQLPSLSWGTASATASPQYSAPPNKVRPIRHDPKPTSESTYQPVLPPPPKIAPKNLPKVDPVLLQNSRVEVLLDEGDTQSMSK
jgi:hypothetical protein